MVLWWTAKIQSLKDLPVRKKIHPLFLCFFVMISFDSKRFSKFEMQPSNEIGELQHEDLSSASLANTVGGAGFQESQIGFYKVSVIPWTTGQLW
jgi:hypothetical protein